MKTYSMLFDSGDLYDIMADVQTSIDLNDINSVYTKWHSAGKMRLWIVLKYHKDYMLLTLKYGTQERKAIPSPNRQYRVHKAAFGFNRLGLNLK
jgi:hypothetical protein